MQRWNILEALLDARSVTGIYLRVTKVQNPLFSTGAAVGDNALERFKEAEHTKIGSMGSDEAGQSTVVLLSSCPLVLLITHLNTKFLLLEVSLTELSKPANSCELV